ncbi:hypothetical protein G7Y89_g1904 [Cudoniella acicularis]|uniref:Uncharacterized protein n=1 Tax=Cudoniella acicularis TaxID=354080 RepID=A0A8H4RW29_9HELO|nr:hypothetical protein G7Y89_g1904 [Cudoniella acicularis]
MDFRFNQWKHESSATGDYNHPDIELHANSRMDFSQLILSSHTHTQLTGVLQKIIFPQRVANLMIPTPRQKDAVKVFHVITESNDIDNEQTPLENLELVMQFFNVFDDMFFNGALHGLCDIKFAPDVFQLTWGFSVNPTHEKKYRKKIPDDFAAVIVLRNLTESPLGNSLAWSRRKMLKQYLMELLHEMFHCFFGIYLCQCNDECRGNCDNRGNCKEIKEEKCELCAEVGAEKAVWQLLGENWVLSRYYKFPDS